MVSLLLAASVVCPLAAQCVSTVETLSLSGFQPNRPAGPVAAAPGIVAIAKVDPPANQAVLAGIYDAATLSQLVDDFVVAPSSAFGPVDLLWTGTEFGAFYQDRDARLFLQRFSTAGVLIGGPVQITPELNFTARDEFDIVWSAARDAYVIAHNVTRVSAAGLYVSVVERDGTTRDDILINFSPADKAVPRVAVNDSGIIGVFFNHQRGSLNMVRLELDDVVRASIPITDPSPSYHVVAIGGVFGLARQAPAPVNGSVIRWLVVDSSAQVVVTERTIVTGSGLDVVPLALIAANGEIALSYADWKKGVDVPPAIYRLRRFRLDGSLISDSPFAADPIHESILTQDDIVWTGSGYVSTVSRAGSRGRDSFALLTCPVIANAEVSRVYVRVNEDVDFSASASGGRPDYSYLWNFGDFSTSTFQSLSKKYNRLGTFTVTLTVTDASGAKGTTTVIVHVVPGKTRSVRH
ncbi:MAG TPA: PKD domain-containing protein [Thermoanaerobaculia bacterium]